VPRGGGGGEEEQPGQPGRASRPHDAIGVLVDGNVERQHRAACRPFYQGSCARGGAVRGGQRDEELTWMGLHVALGRVC
jgi:hypothetical protein